MCDSAPRNYWLTALLISIGIGGGDLLGDKAFAEANCTPPTAKPPLCLTGTVTAPGVGIATIERAGSADPKEFHPGDTILDWRIVEIGPKYVKLAQDDQTITLDLLNRTPSVPEPASAAEPDPPAPATPTSRLNQGPLRNTAPRIARGERDPADLPP